jgi:hypothetical protein
MEARPVFLNGENIGRLEHSWRRNRPFFAYLPRGTRAVGQGSSRVDVIEALLKKHAEQNGAVVPDRVRQTSRGHNRMAVPSMPGVEVTPSADTNVPTGVFIDGQRVGSIHYNGRTSHYTVGTSRLPSPSFPGGRLSRDAALQALVAEMRSSPEAQQEAADGRREVAASLARQRRRAEEIRRRQIRELRARDEARQAANRRRRDAANRSYMDENYGVRRSFRPTWVGGSRSKEIFKDIPDGETIYELPAETSVRKPVGVKFLGEKDGIYYYFRDGDSQIYTIRNVNGYWVGSHAERAWYDKEAHTLTRMPGSESAIASDKDFDNFLRTLYGKMSHPPEYGERPASFKRGFGNTTAPLWLKDVIEEVKAGTRKPKQVSVPHDNDGFTLDDPSVDPEYAILALSAFEVEGNGFTSIVNLNDSNFYGDELHVSGTIFYNGTSAGNFSMEVQFGRKNIYAASMDVDSSRQSQGFAMIFAMQSQSTIAGQGIQTVTVTANCDVGGYAWASRGFAFKDKGDSAAAKPFFREIAEASPGDRIKGGRNYEEATGYDFIASERIIAAAKVMLARYDGPQSNWPESWEIASFGEDMPETHWTKKPHRGNVDIPMWPGKGAMLGSHWAGIRPVFIADEFKAMGDDWMKRVWANLPYAESVYVPDDYLNWNLRSDYHLMSADVLLGPAGMESKSVPLNANDIATTLASLQGVMEKE